MSSAPLLPAGEKEEAWEQHCKVIKLTSPPSRRRRVFENVFWLGTPVVLGVALGFLLPTSHSLPEPFNRISSVVGWIYFCAWSISFYPQAWLNFRRKSVAGLSLDFQLLNMLGFSCYAVYNAAMKWSPTVRHEYACLNGGQLPSVHANDVFFALHAAVLTAVALCQCIFYDRGGQKVSWPAALATGASLATIAAYLSAVVGAAAQGGGSGPLPPPPSMESAALDAAAVAEHVPVPCGNILSWLSFLYFLSYIKLGVSLVKYIPQVYLNYSRKSTDGWNIHNILLDFGGGLLSLAQQVMDSVVNDCWTPITGNPVKFGLGFASMFFDIIFMAQHWCLYPAGGLQSAKAWAAAHGKAGSSASTGTAAAAVLLAAPGGSGSSLGQSSAQRALLVGKGGEISEEPVEGEGADLEAGSRSGRGGGSSSSRGVVVAADHAPLLR